MGLATTSALELGVSISGLDAVLIAARVAPLTRAGTMAGRTTWTMR